MKVTTVVSGSQTGRMYSHAMNYGKRTAEDWLKIVTANARKWHSVDWAVGREVREKRVRREIKALRMSKTAQRAFDKRMTMKKPYAINSMVRRKNDVYHQWRSEHTWPRIERACVECMLRFEALPRWEEWVEARRSQDWNTADRIFREHIAWKKEVRDWALASGITRFRMQSAQFLKFYFAWWRYEYEQAHGPITRTYGRQMS